MLSTAASEGLYDPHPSTMPAAFERHCRPQSNDIVRRSLQVLVNLQHRGAKGCEANTGDGAGILLQIPHEFLKAECKKLGFELPTPGNYGVGMVCLPRDSYTQRWCKEIIEAAIARAGQKLLGWRDVPTNNEPIGDSAKRVEPVFSQVFVERDAYLKTVDDFERRLYLIRKHRKPQPSCFGSARRERSSTACCRPTRSRLHLVDSGGVGVAVVHQRFSTNTFPSWSLPSFRYISHNGDQQRCAATLIRREAQFQTELFGDDIKDILPYRGRRQHRAPSAARHDDDDS
jgi:glutamate synthase (ferredoxin)